MLASATDEWVEKISRLIEDSELRSRLGKAARKTVVDKYSVLSQQDVYVNTFRKLINQK